MISTLMSQKTYANAVTAQRACAKVGRTFAGTQTLPSGRVAYLHTRQVAAVEPKYIRADGVEFIKPNHLSGCVCNWCVGAYDHMLVK